MAIGSEVLPPLVHTGHDLSSDQVLIDIGGVRTQPGWLLTLYAQTPPMLNALGNLSVSDNKQVQKPSALTPQVLDTVMDMIKRTATGQLPVTTIRSGAGVYTDA